MAGICRHNRACRAHRLRRVPGKPNTPGELGHVFAAQPPPALQGNKQCAAMAAHLVGAGTWRFPLRACAELYQFPLTTDAGRRQRHGCQAGAIGTLRRAATPLLLSAVVVRGRDLWTSSSAGRAAWNHRRKRHGAGGRGAVTNVRTVKLQICVSPIRTVSRLNIYEPHLDGKHARKRAPGGPNTRPRDAGLTVLNTPSQHAHKLSYI